MKSLISHCALLITLFAATGRAAEKSTAPPPVLLRDFKLVGELAGDRAAFTLTANAVVDSSRGGSLELLAGTVALTEIGPHPKWQLRAEQGRYVAEFERRGTFPVQIKFTAAVRPANGWNTVEFKLTPGPLQSAVLRGLGPDTQFDFVGAARPERRGNDFVSTLPSDGSIRLSWKEARKEEEGRLFYAAEMLAQISVSPGLMRQVALVDGKIMQGELNRVTLNLQGAGEVTRVQGEQVLSWNVEPLPGGSSRRLTVQFNQPQRDRFALAVQMQTQLGAFPQTAEVLRLQPEGATRFAGHVRIVNEGAVRLEVTQASGLSQISPEQFPETDLTKSALRVTGGQRFVYRFSGAEFALRIQADQVLPELGVSEVIAYHHGENELAIDAEIELDVREAPLRELLLHVPRGYAIAMLNASGMSDRFLREVEGAPDAELRLVYGQPVLGRQVIQLRLERNQALGAVGWELPRIEVVRARSVRGHIGVSADAGFRLTPDARSLTGLTEIATAFFPRKVAGLQAAFRLSDPAWRAALTVERLPQTVQADAFHLFSIGEGIAYGSSVMNYVISGAPVSVFRVELSGEYFNVEFAGKDVRSWQKTTNGYAVQLHSPVAGAYTLLATYERPFKAQGDTLAFTGVRPLDAQSEQGHTLVISAYQFQVRPVDVSPSLLPLETGEVPAEYRLFFDAPILAAYRYTARPFSLRLALSPLVQGDSLSQIVDRAALVTRISKEGQVLTDARYLVKNRGNTHFRLVLPAGTELWSASVNGGAVVPVKDAQANLIPLPQRADPNAVLVVDVKLAARSAASSRVAVAAPVISAPVLLADWRLEPDAGQRLIYRRGSLTPIGGRPDVSGFGQLARTFSSDDSRPAKTAVAAALALLALAVLVWRKTAVEGVYKLSARHFLGTTLGLIAFGLAIAAGWQLDVLTRQARQFPPRDVMLLAPVQQSNSALSIEVDNIADTAPSAVTMADAWPALVGLALWFIGWIRPAVRLLTGLPGWTLIAWAALRCPNGATGFLLMMAAFLIVRVAWPALRRLQQLPPEPPTAQEPPESPTSRGPDPVVTALLVGLLTLGLTSSASAATREETGRQLLAQATPPNRGTNPPVTRQPARVAAPPQSTSVPLNQPRAESVVQQIKVEDGYVLATATVRWQAEKGQVLPLVYSPAVLTRLVYPSNNLDLAPGVGPRSSQQLIAQRSGLFSIEFQYQLPVAKRGTESGIALPVPSGLVNQVQATVVNRDVDVRSVQAISIRREISGSNTLATLVLAPLDDAWIGWQPRSRDLKGEKSVFYAELTQLYAPAAGVIEGSHVVSIRPAQGELGELILDVPRGATVTDVTEIGPRSESRPVKSIVSLWRFDPDTRKLRVSLSPAQSRTFALLVRSQVATGPLPFEQSVGLLSVNGAAEQIGLLGVATGGEVQLDAVSGDALSPLNLEDFPADAVVGMAGQISGLTVRRAFRYAGSSGLASLKASPVEPDVRVETQDTLSLGEDRTVLASTATVDITRAGIFRLSFLLPSGFDVESITGSSMSHWTELKSEAGRVVTLHLQGKTLGRQQFAISLAGPGARATNGWAVPQLILREAGKQQGLLVIVPEQGMRLQPVDRAGVTQPDPQSLGIRQKGVLAFRILQTPWRLTLDLEQVEPWIQVTSLQHATVNEAQVKVVANLQYQIENTGLKSFRVLIPTNAMSVRFQGEQVSDFVRLPGAVTNGLQVWEIKLQRRVIGQYLLQATYQTVLPEQATEAVLQGVQASEINLQRGFVTVQVGGRLQVRIDVPPAALQPAEWQSIPRALQQNLPSASANFAFRLVDPSFQLALKLDRHEAARLLPARVNNITFTSVISDAGVMLTQVRLEMMPGDLPLLKVRLPHEARFWFAFVNQHGVWPWREQDQILIPLERPSQGGRLVPVELFYSTQAGAHLAALELQAPQFDLPLENLRWNVYLNEKWRMKNWHGSLQLQGEQIVSAAAALDLQVYLQTEAGLQKEKTQAAEQMLALGNNALQQGDPQQARRAFQAAFGLSAHDNAFNEDARVQLHNLKLQQALVGLNVRQAAAGGGNAPLGVRLRDRAGLRDVNYTQQDAKEMIDRNSADENAAYLRLAERLVQQQDAAVSSPAAIRASIPEQGRLLTFQRAVVVDRNADLKISLVIEGVRTVSWGVRGLILGATLLTFMLLAWAVRVFRIRVG